MSDEKVASGEYKNRYYPRMEVEVLLSYRPESSDAGDGQVQRNADLLQPAPGVPPGSAMEPGQEQDAGGHQGQQRVGPSGRDKTSILVSTRNEPGALYKILEPFHRHGISLSRIETRPARSGSWSYVFFIDFDGHGSEPAIEAVMREVGDVAMEVRSLGSYPQAVV